MKHIVEGPQSSKGKTVELRRQDLEQLEELFQELATLCHKINNPLTSLLGRSQLLQQYVDMDPRVKKAGAVIEDSAKRVSAYLRELALAIKEGREGVVERALESGADDVDGDQA